ncbi:MAG: NAD-dependent epimerase/dehydratase family protein [Candidatus Omnitrophota bacterium]
MKLPYKRILITGGAGFVGSNLALRFKDSYPRIKVIALDNLKRRGSELALGRLKTGGIDFIHGDIRNKDDFEGLSYDLLIECSAEPSCIAGIDKGLSYLFNTNLAGAFNCFEHANNINADVLFLSTSRVYPYERINALGFKENKNRFILSGSQALKGVSSKGIREDFTLSGAKTFYGASKFACELLLEEFIHFRKLRAIVNRCGVIAGPWQMGKVDQGIVVFWINSHIYNRPLNYLGWSGTGKQVRDCIHIDDLFSLINLQLLNFSENSGKTFNIGGGLECSFSLRELTEACKNITSNKVPIYGKNKTREGDLCWYITDYSYAASVFNWRPKKKFFEVVEDVAGWIVNNKSVLADIL